MRIFLLMICLAFSLAACKGEAPSSTDKQQKKESEKSADDPTQKAMKEGY
jgi:hypothetical protein